MAFCPKCGTQLTSGSAFCSSCGAAVSAQSTAPGSGAATAPAQSEPTSPGLTNNLAGALCYFLWFITGIVFLAIEPYKRNRFVRFHAFQAIFAGAALFVFWIIWSTVFVSMIFAGALGFVWFLTRLIQLAILVAWLFLMYKAYNNEEFKLPYLGDLAAKQAGS
jgi:uncharacterized membrane protein